MLYELRNYELLPGKAPAINARFANVTLKLFAKHGIRVVGFWENLIGTSNQLIYMLAWQSLAEREQVWNAFQSDPEWIKNRAETEKEGPQVARIVNTIMRPTSYSPMQ